jgi:Na+/H+-dicarboxylate symporter
MPIYLLACILFAVFFGANLSLTTIRFFYTISSIIIEILLFLMPLLVFIFLFSSLLALGKKAPLFIAILLVIILISNCLGLLFSYSAARLFLPEFAIKNEFILVADGVLALFNFYLPKLISIENTMLYSVALVIILVFMPASLINHQKLEHKFNLLQQHVLRYLVKFLMPLLPLYVFGFTLKMQHEGNLHVLFTNFKPILGINILLVISYTFLLYLFASYLLKQKFIPTLSNMLPAGVAAFTTMSSAATLPLTIIGIEKNLKNSKQAQLFGSVTANIHVIGDGITITFTSLALLYFSHVPLPDLLNFMPYIFFFSLANLSCIGIPGGSIFIILPILQKYLGLSYELSSILTTIYILQDPISTSTNVLGNGAFGVFLSKIFKKFRIV